MLSLPDLQAVQNEERGAIGCANRDWRIVLALPVPVWSCSARLSDLFALAESNCHLPAPTKQLDSRRLTRLHRCPQAIRSYGRAINAQ